MVQEVKKTSRKSTGPLLIALWVEKIDTDIDTCIADTSI